MGQKILVVEDNELNLKLFCDLLRAHGYASGAGARRPRSRRPRPRLRPRPDRHGHPDAACQRARADRATEGRRRAAGGLRSWRSPLMPPRATRSASATAGAEGYVSKPISVVRFVEAVQALLAAPRPEEESDGRGAGDPAHRTRLPRRCSTPGWTRRRPAEWLFATPEGEMVRVEIDPASRRTLRDRRAARRRGRPPHRHLRGDRAAASGSSSPCRCRITREYRSG